MNGPEHYAQAERLLRHADQRMAQDETQWLRTYDQRTFFLAQAQVHATLALAVATAAGAHLPDHVAMKAFGPGEYGTPEPFKTPTPAELLDGPRP